MGQSRAFCEEHQPGEAGLPVSEMAEAPLASLMTLLY
jgi:hypothetical protein